MPRRPAENQTQQETTKSVPEETLTGETTFKKRRRSAEEIKRQRDVFEAHASGLAMSTICERFKLSRSYVFKLIAREGKRPGIGTEAARAVECEKLDERERLARTMLMQNRADGPQAIDKDGNPVAYPNGRPVLQKVFPPGVLAKFDSIMTSIAAHRARIMGLDAPIQIESRVSEEHRQFLQELRDTVAGGDLDVYERILAQYAAKGGSGGAGEAPTREGGTTSH